MAAHQGKIHLGTTAGMRQIHHGNFKVQRFQLFEKSKKTIVPLVLLCPTFRAGFN